MGQTGTSGRQIIRRILRRFTSREHRAAWIFAAATLATILLVLTILLPRAARTGLWCDELLFQHAIASTHSGDLLVAGSSHPPLVRLICRPLVAAEGPDWLVRLPSLLAAAATVVVWSRLLRRLVPDLAARCLLLPAMSLSTAWLGVAYQLVPYAFWVLFVSLHALSWLWLEERRDLARATALVVTGALAAWTHFYGLNVLLADQIVWAVLLWRGAVAPRVWLRVTLATLVLTAPLVPLVAFYSTLDGPYLTAPAEDYTAYLARASARIFARTTWYGFRVTLPLYLLWYAMAGGLLLAVARGARQTAEPRETDRRPVVSDWAVAVVAGLFFCGLPAMQAHAWLTQKIVWDRYALAGAWLHLPLLAVLLGRLRRTVVLRAAGGAWLALGLLAASLGDDAQSLATRDYRPVVRHLERHARPGDAFLAQDFDLWNGPGNFDRLWFERYGRVPLPVVTGSGRRRAELLLRPLDLEPLAERAERLWVFSPMYNDAMLRAMESTQWRLAAIHHYGRNYPLALFVRRPSPESASRPIAS